MSSEYEPFTECQLAALERTFQEFHPTTETENRLLAMARRALALETEREQGTLAVEELVADRNQFLRERDEARAEVMALTAEHGGFVERALLAEIRIVELEAERDALRERVAYLEWDYQGKPMPIALSKPPARLVMTVTLDPTRLRLMAAAIEAGLTKQTGRSHPQSGKFTTDFLRSVATCLTDCAHSLEANTAHKTDEGGK